MSSILQRYERFMMVDVKGSKVWMSQSRGKLDAKTNVHVLHTHAHAKAMQT
jgi:hypothetical protein